MGRCSVYDRTAEELTPERAKSADIHLVSKVRLATKQCWKPHIAWALLAARKRLMAIVTANVAAFLDGAPINVVNRQFLKQD